MAVKYFRSLLTHDPLIEGCEEESFYHEHQIYVMLMLLIYIEVVVTVKEERDFWYGHKTG